MNITFQSVFTYVIDAVLESYPGISFADKYEPIPEDYPNAFISVREISRVRTGSNVTLDYDDEQYRSTIEIQIQTDTMAEAESIMDTAESAMNRLHYLLMMREPVDTRSGHKYRLVARLSRQICGADQMPS